MCSEREERVSETVREAERGQINRARVTVREREARARVERERMLTIITLTMELKNSRERVGDSMSAFC